MRRDTPCALYPLCKMLTMLCFVLTRSPHQLKFHSAFERATARVLYRDVSLHTAFLHTPPFPCNLTIAFLCVLCRTGALSVQQSWQQTIGRRARPKCSSGEHDLPPVVYNLVQLLTCLFVCATVPRAALARHSQSASSPPVWR